MKRAIHDISSSTIKIGEFKISCFIVVFCTVKGKNIDTMIGHETVMSQRRFTTLEDPDASPVAVALQHSLGEKTAVSSASMHPIGTNTANHTRHAILLSSGPRTLSPRSS